MTNKKDPGTVLFSYIREYETALSAAEEALLPVGKLKNESLAKLPFWKRRALAGNASVCADEYCACEAVTLNEEGGRTPVDGSSKEVAASVHIRAGDVRLRTAYIVPVLVARDKINSVVSARTLRDEAILSRIASGDHRLKILAALHLPEEETKQVSLMRSVLSVSDVAWWWLAFEIDENSQPVPVMLTAIQVLCLALTLCLATDISKRFFAGGPDVVSMASLLVQGGLAVVSGSALTHAGRVWIRQFLGLLKIKEKAFLPFKVLLSFTILLVMSGCHRALPWFSEIYTAKSMAYFFQGQLTRADLCSQRAAALNPDSALPHYMRALTLLETRQYDECKSECRLALKLEDSRASTHILLARVLILSDKKFAEAVVLLDRAENLLARKKVTLDAPRLSVDDKALLYTLYKTRSWACFYLRSFDQAEQDSDAAVSLNRRGTLGGGVFCLQGLILDKRGKNDAAASAWDDCARFTTPGEDIDPAWLLRARGN